MEIIRTEPVYASGARRLLAWIIDMVIMSVLMMVLFPFKFHFAQPFHWGFVHWGFGLKWALTLLYFSAMESSKYQATVGKLLMGMQVTNLKGQRLDFARALLRNVSKVISGIIFGIGYIMILFDKHRQGLHDKIADTYVIRANTDETKMA